MSRKPAPSLSVASSAGLWDSCSGFRANSVGSDADLDPCATPPAVPDRGGSGHGRSGGPIQGARQQQGGSTAVGPRIMTVSPFRTSRYRPVSMREPRCARPSRHRVGSTVRALLPWIIARAPVDPIADAPVPFPGSRVPIPVSSYDCRLFLRSPSYSRGLPPRAFITGRGFPPRSRVDVVLVSPVQPVPVRRTSARAPSERLQWVRLR